MSVSTRLELPRIVWATTTVAANGVPLDANPTRDRVRLPSALVRATYAFAQERGIVLDIDLPSDGDVPVVSPRQAREILEAVAAASGDMLLGLHLAERIEKGAYGVVEFACRSAPTLEGAMERVVRFTPLLSLPAVAAIEDRGPLGKVLRFRFRDIRGTLGRHGNEFFAAIMWRRAMELTGKKFRPTVISFEHPAPACRTEIERYFGVTQATFDAEWNEIGFDSAALTHPIVSHEPTLLPLLDKMAEQEVAGRKMPSGLVDEVATHVRASLAKGEPALDDIAKALGMSGRTLQRRLNEEETPFAEIVDSMRYELALTYVADGHRTDDEVAALLGYAGSRAFQRAFKRWTGKTPTDYRKR
jgi:AraC-like DNA-binding protein